MHPFLEFSGNEKIENEVIKIRKRILYTLTITVSINQSIFFLFISKFENIWK